MYFCQFMVTYVESFINKVFNQKLSITMDDKSQRYSFDRRHWYAIYEFWNKTDNELFSDFQDYTFKGDIIGTIFFFLSGYWEYKHQEIKDDVGRFPASESFLGKLGILDIPVVDILLERIKNELNLTYRRNIPWLFITHDIDYLATKRDILKNALGDILKRRHIRTGLAKMFGKISSKKRVEYLIELHNKNNTKGTYFFLPRKQDGIFSAGYNLCLKKRYIQKISRIIVQNNSSIGIHYDTRYLEREDMKADIEILEGIIGKKIYFGRSHWLLFDIQKTFDILEKSGIILDTTGGYADVVGFRFGTSHPFRPFNFKTGKAYDLIEVPLIVMEGTLFQKKYMALDANSGFQKIRDLIDTVKRYNGVFTFLWHNTSFENSEFNADWVYEETIKYATLNGFKSVNSEEIVNFYLHE